MGKSLGGVLMLGFILGAAVQAADKEKTKDRTADDQARMLGTWKIVRGEDQGKAAEKDRFKDATVVITKDTIRIQNPDVQQNYVLSYTLNPSHDPKTIDMKVQEGPDQGKTAKGIYTFTKDQHLKICYALPGNP